MRLLYLSLILLLTPLAQAAEPLRVDPITPLDQRFMDNATAELNSLAQIKTGRSFSGERERDLELLQLMLDRNLVDGDDTKLMQAMGIVMAQHLQKAHNLKWVIYVDNVGRSRALEVPFKEDFIFPVTQISSRAAVGADINVQAIYDKLEKEVAQIRKKIIVH
ncbi:protein of unknown function (DUF3806) [Spongiibacter sp. IMCC21906]|jgi:hypothetical protein|uniref:DUF3806 domain-containing protein n=1 Tax=Spongiibacter sp. IMCC21906 TaxID=1620392 RepID=UPI00062E0A41|nr:DUF3806 domain-containing protein [Spongiibacter sp. IMCC21906]AKH70316.1 protein of unknown function (DUF3806) [Spongiibacter sp. IMCC21906]